MFEQIKIVLLEPSHPGNIGAAARAMKNMGLSQLCLVNPVKFPDVEATVRASGADDLLANAKVVESVQEAIADCDCIMGTSARSRAIPWPLLNPSEAAELLDGSKFKQTAVLFGRENSGLTNQELSLCQYHIHIPTVESFSSLNLASAILLVCYEIRMKLLQKISFSRPLERDSELATAKQLNGYYEHLSKIMKKLGMLNPRQPKRLMQRLQRLYNRSHLEVNELNILRGFLSAVEKNVE
ncbi:MAG: RNA methyltransferase [Gammaproteobacteria bacterium]|nr:RNA methyltransferase [Gammaproteobacteria bacterium]MCH9744159.1 RNA methyltransferase [Gammaproteobacteria bacterium]